MPETGFGHAETTKTGDVATLDVNRGGYGASRMWSAMTPRRS